MLLHIQFVLRNEYKPTNVHIEFLRALSIPNILIHIWRMDLPIVIIRGESTFIFRGVRTDF